MQEFWSASAARYQADIEDSTLTAPINGRVLYRLAEPGEVLGVGGHVLALLDISDVSMTLFLPTSQAGRIALGAQARIVLDVRPDISIPAQVTLQMSLVIHFSRRHCFLGLALLRAWVAKWGLPEALWLFSSFAGKYACCCVLPVLCVGPVVLLALPRRAREWSNGTGKGGTRSAANLRLGVDASRVV